MLSSREGKAIRFAEEEVRVMGRGARGVKGITLGETDYLVAMDILSPGATGSTILSVTENGFGKRSPSDDSPCRVGAAKGSSR